MDDLSRTPAALLIARDRKQGVRAVITGALRQAARAVERAGEAPQDVRDALAYWGLEQRFAGELERYGQAHAAELEVGQAGRRPPIAGTAGGRCAPSAAGAGAASRRTGREC